MQKFKQMNRLIIIGNGFDIAHGLKTSYADFIKAYIAKAINTFCEKGIHDDGLLKITNRAGVKSGGVRANPEDALATLKHYSSTPDYFRVTIKSLFLNKAVSNISSESWVDLEQEYFDELVKYRNSTEAISKLNQEFDLIKQELESYLTQLESSNPIEISENILKIFHEKIKADDIVTVDIADHVPGNVMVLSFNYTNTVEKYRGGLNQIVHTQINHIHGRLGEDHNPIIFGYGDNYNKNYLEFEEIRNKELLKFIKAFEYPKTSNYHDLTRFVGAEHFQVYVFGHSLGLSDRTMLKHIFEHDNCKSIKLFYYKDLNDYMNKIYDIASHFTDKDLMTRKIVPFDKSFAMPQPKEEVKNMIPDFA